MAFEKLTENIKEFTDNTEQYVITTSEYYKLSLFKNGMKALIGGANLAIRGVLGLLILTFISLGAAIYIGEQIDSKSAGYFIIGGVYIVIFILVFVFASKPLERYFLEKYSKMAFDEDSITEADTVYTKNSSTSNFEQPINNLPDESL